MFICGQRLLLEGQNCQGTATHWELPSPIMCMNKLLYLFSLPGLHSLVITTGTRVMIRSSLRPKFSPIEISTEDPEILATLRWSSWWGAGRADGGGGPSGPPASTSFLTLHTLKGQKRGVCVCACVIFYHLPFRLGLSLGSMFATLTSFPWMKSYGKRLQP